MVTDAELAFHLGRGLPWQPSHFPAFPPWHILKGRLRKLPRKARRAACPR